MALSMSRREVADAHGVHEATLRTDERDGLLPEFGTCPLEGYRAAVDLVKAARAGGLSPRRIRAALAVSREGGLMATAYDQIRESAKNHQRDNMARYGVVLPDVDALRIAAEEDPERWARYQAEVAAGTYDVAFLRRGLRALDERPASRASANPAMRSPINATVQLIDSMVDERVKAAGGRLTPLEARRRVFEERPDLYQGYRNSTTRNRGPGGES